MEHSYHNFPSIPFKKYWMHFDVYPRKDIVKLLGIDYLVHLSDTKKADELFSRFAKLYGSGNFADTLSVKGIAFELLSMFIKIICFEVFGQLIFLELVLNFLKTACKVKIPLYVDSNWQL